MNLFGISINHRTSTIEQRESLHFSEEEILDYIPILQKNIFNEGIIISTCNRTEIFGYSQDVGINYKHLINNLKEYKPSSIISEENCEKYFSCSAVKHLLSVSAGIDSLIVGDSQILSQVKNAIDISKERSFTGFITQKLFDTTIRVGKRAIRETSIGEGAVSVSYAAVQVIEKIFSNLSTKKALVIGAGETGELAAVHLFDKGIGNMAITNRTRSKAENLAKKVMGSVVDFNQLSKDLYNYDVIISATSAPGYLIDYADIKKAMIKRRGKPIVLMDIALPRDIDPKTGKLDYVFYNDIDSLQSIVDQNLKKRYDEIPLVKQIILDEMIGYFGWFNSLDIIPTIKNLREFFDEIRLDEIHKIKNKVSDEDFIKIEDMTRRLIGRILHNPTINLKRMAQKSRREQHAADSAAALIDLFNLNGSTNEEN